MYRSIAILGLGSLGSFVSYSISQLDQVEKIILVDYDIVLQKNLRNAIYKIKDLGRLKVDALKDLIENTNSEISITSINKKFIEGKTKIPKCDLVIDCRDFTYDRTSLINARLYISSRYLVVDCRKNIQYETQYKGKYLSKLTKTDLRNAGLIFSILVEKNKIDEFIKFETVNKFDLDHLQNEIQNNQDILYDSGDEKIEKKLINLPQNIHRILKTNKDYPINLMIGSKNNPIYEKQIPKNLLNSPSDLISNLGTAITISPIFNTFILSFQKQDNQYILELIPETGAA